ncbi:hypothetical protein TNIN_210581 [Trichonephila inaurata madagascariensis]|uniref:Ionotropic glutamate receptor L-glutamate and glycine-binding domain-containing protein n=1 Tax=Trichonephila inaurata madagascariensis TaxID=2747483 RepID=A0A8X6XHM2_9ARAC|nr:hypothetical protein TNIN_372181 [Trichonephila inaurata madagascariensis]GFY61487.1 hypothetical protein TNIN_210581 [Trichonephila inaurata madagascariensis]
MQSLYFPTKLKVAGLIIRSIFDPRKVNNKIVIEGANAKLLDCLAEKLNFEFEILTTLIGGSRHSNGTWSGVIGLVQKGEADIRLEILVFFLKNVSKPLISATRMVP